MFTISHERPVQGGTTATYECENRIEGEDTRTCSCDGTWSAIPTCAEGTPITGIIVYVAG